MKVVYVADTDLMLPVFLQIRAEPDQATDMRFQFQNVTFLLNTVDWLTGESDFIDVRKHEPIFASLRMIDSVKEEASSAVRRQTQEFQDEFDETETTGARRNGRADEAFARGIRKTTKGRRHHTRVARCDSGQGPNAFKPCRNSCSEN